MRLSLLLGLLLAALSLAPGSAGATITGGTTFDTVDAIEVNSSSVRITGLVVGEETAREVSFNFNSNTERREACLRMFTLSLHKPGVYTVQVNATNTGTVSSACRIARRAL